MTDLMDELMDSVFDARPEGGTRYVIAETEIGPVMFGSDGSMRYGDNYSTPVLEHLREVALEALRGL